MMYFCGFITLLERGHPRPELTSFFTAQDVRKSGNQVKIQDVIEGYKLTIKRVGTNRGNAKRPFQAPGEIFSKTSSEAELDNNQCRNRVLTCWNVTSMPHDDSESLLTEFLAF